MPGSVDSLLDQRLYTMGQVDRLLRLRNGTARRWIDGYVRSGRTYAPVVREVSTGDEIATWGEFVETQLLAHYRRGVSMQAMRPAIESLREQFNRRYPLAYARPYLDVVGHELVLRAQVFAQLPQELQLVVVARNGQLTLADPASQFVASVDFGQNPDIQSSAVLRVFPLVDRRAVAYDPELQFGDPTTSGVPTAVLAEQVRAGDAPELVAQLYGIAVSDVQAAIELERELSRAA